MDLKNYLLRNTYTDRQAKKERGRKEEGRKDRGREGGREMEGRN